MNWFIKVLKQYADFKGRARRKEYWMFTLFNVLILILILLLENVFDFMGVTFDIASKIFLTYFLLIFIPGLAVTVRRLHDIGKSGWMFFVILLPFGKIWLLILLVRESKSGSNKWGVNPKDSINEIDEIGQEVE